MAHESPRASLAAGGADVVSARSYLYVPGDQARKLQHALGSGADAIIADLEDAVAPSAKANARRTVADWLATQLAGDHPELWVRVNAAARLLGDDLQVAVGPAVTGICLPKTHTPEQIRSLGEQLAAAERQAGLAEGAIKVVPLLESAAGILSAQAIAQEPRVWQLGLGELDLCAEVGIQPSADERELLLPVRVQVVLASAAAGLDPPIGPVSTDFRDLVALRRSTEALRRVGSAADGQSIPPRCRSSTRRSRLHSSRWRPRGGWSSAMTVPLSGVSVSASTRMARWWMKPLSAPHVEPWRGLVARPSSPASLEMSGPSPFLVRTFCTISRPALRAAACGGRPRPAGLELSSWSKRCLRLA